MFAAPEKGAWRPLVDVATHEYVSVGGLHSCPEKFGNDDDENLREREIHNTEFSAQAGAVRLDFRFGL